MSCTIIKSTLLLDLIFETHPQVKNEQQAVYAALSTLKCSLAPRLLVTQQAYAW